MNHIRVRNISPKFPCIKFFQIRDVPTQILGHPGHSLSKTTEKATCIKFLSGISRRLGPGCPRNVLPKNFMFRLFFGPVERKRKRLDGSLDGSFGMNRKAIEHI